MSVNEMQTLTTDEFIAEGQLGWPVSTISLVFCCAPSWTPRSLTGRGGGSDQSFPFSGS